MAGVVGTVTVWNGVDVRLVLSITDFIGGVGTCMVGTCMNGWFGTRLLACCSVIEERPNTFSRFLHQGDFFQNRLFA